MGTRTQLPNHVVTGIAALDNTPISDLPPLTETIDPDALELIATESSSPVTVSFEYAGYDVVVQATDTTTATVTIEPT